MANTICIYHVHFLDITCKSIIGDNDCTELRDLLMLMIVRIVDFCVCLLTNTLNILGAFT